MNQDRVILGLGLAVLLGGSAFVGVGVRNGTFTAHQASAATSRSVDSETAAQGSSQDSANASTVDNSSSAVAQAEPPAPTPPPLTPKLKKQIFEDSIVGWALLQDHRPDITLEDGTLRIAFNGQVCGTYGAGSYPTGDTKHFMADALITAYTDYSSASTYEYYCKHDADGNSFRARVSREAIEHATAGRGESAQLHISVDHVAQNVELKRDGLPASE